jgi:hypothetical protein
MAEARSARDPVNFLPRVTIPLLLLPVGHAILVPEIRSTVIR